MMTSRRYETQENLGSTNQEQHFREISEAYVRSRRQNIATRRYHQYWDDRLHALIDSKFGRNARYLDPMCGAGLFLDNPLSLFDEVLVCDISDEMLGYILPEVSSRLAYCEKQDVRQLTFPSNYVDIVLIRGGLHHVANFLPHALAELYRVLKPGGQFIFSEPVDTGYVVRLVRRLMYTRSSVFEPEDERGLTLEEIRRLTAEAGFTRLFYEPFTHFAYALIGNTDFFNPLPWLRSATLVNACIRFDDLSRKVPLWNRLCWIGNFSCYKP